MDKPKKQNINWTKFDGWSKSEQVGYNQACDDWESWIINSLEAIKTDMNQKEIDGSIREIKGE